MIFGNVTIYDSPVTNLTQYIFSVNNTELENDTVIGVFNETTFVIGGYFNSSMFSVEYETQNETIYEQMLANLMNNESIMLNINTIVEIETTLNNTIDNDVDNDVNNTVVNSDENSNVNDNRDTVNIFFLQGRLTWDDPLSWVLIILASTLLVGAIIKTNVSRVKAKRNFRPSNEIGQSSKVKVELSDRATPLDKVLNNFWAKQRRANVNLVGVPSGKVKTVKFTGVGKEQPNRLAKNLDETIYYLDGTENF